MVEIDQLIDRIRTVSMFLLDDQELTALDATDMMLVGMALFMPSENMLTRIISLAKELSHETDEAS